VRQKSIGEVIKRLEAAGFRIVGMKMVHLTAEKAGAFYAVHKERPFYQSLIQFMSSGPIVPIVLEGENIIERLRTLMGATDPTKAAEGTIRKDLASNVEQNVIHGSDSETSASTEIPFFFSPQEMIS
jgi:nucleoside-diphosphate kinase